MKWLNLMTLGYGTGADTYFTWDPGEWRLLSRSSKHRDVTLESVLGGIAARPAGSPAEIVVVHDFEAIAGAFEPVLDAIAARGYRFAPLPPDPSI